MNINDLLLWGGLIFSEIIICCIFVLGLLSFIGKIDILLKKPENRKKFGLLFMILSIIIGICIFVLWYVLFL